MKLHIVTIGKPRLGYAQKGWEEYWQRLQRFHTMRVTHIADKHDDAAHILEAAGTAYKVVLEIEGRQFTSPELAQFLERQAQTGREVCFIIGGPEGLPADVRAGADLQWSLGKHTLPHDLAMVVSLEAIYRASTISAGLPYHK